MASVCVLGGSGTYGAVLADTLVKSEAISELVIAGRNVDLARSTAALLGEKARALQTDILDEERLVRDLRDVDLVLNAGGPFEAVGMPALRAAIRARRDFCDLCDVGAIIDKQLELHDAAQQAGITAIVGAGHTPGSTAVLGRYAALRLDEVDTIRTYWVADARMTSEQQRELRQAAGDRRRTLTSVEARLKAISEPIRLYRDKQWLTVPPHTVSSEVPLKRGEPLPLPLVGAGEAVTLPRCVSGVKAVSDFGGLYPPHLNELLEDLSASITRGALTLRRAAELCSEKFEADSDRLLARSGEEDQTGAYATAVGRKDGRPARCDVGFRGCYESSIHGTTVPLAVGALGILRGEVQDKGVLGLEQAFEPANCVRQIADYWLPRPADAPLLDEAITFLN